MKEFRERLIHIHHCRGIGWKSIFRLLQMDSTLSSIFNYTSQQLEKLLPLSKTNLNLFLNDLHSHKIQSMLKQYSYKNIHMITYFDDEYPELLKNIFDPPWVLYASGDISLLQAEKVLSVVGTRNPSTYGHLCMEKVLVPLIKQKWVIISGLAKGIDTYAHKLAMTNEGRTIAVIAGGFHYIYPKENSVLSEQIKQNHLLISEYPPSTKPQVWQFPMRNRIISGLSLGTIIIEAKDRSGSLITADQALQQGREVFAVPGSILEDCSLGTNRLIQEGAKLVLSSEDILSEIRNIKEK